MLLQILILLSQLSHKFQLCLDSIFKEMLNIEIVVFLPYQLSTQFISLLSIYPNLTHKFFGKEFIPGSTNQLLVALFHGDKPIFILHQEILKDKS